RRTSRAKPKPAEALKEVDQIEPVQNQKPAENVREVSGLDSSADDSLGGAHPDGEAELARLDAESGYDDIDRQEYADAADPEPTAAGWDAIQSAGLLHMAFAAVAAGRGAHWVLEDKEAEMLGGSLDQVLNKYFPDGPGKYGPEIALFSSAIVIVAPRLAKDVKLASEIVPGDDVAANDDAVMNEVPE
ncbi:MAG: hypothetical protein Q9M16_10525, partial [Mariprofundus sp.]|nr:hypothetical protein [Mariprofundus sp.]